jgi:predicted  nucleic acid-binding Zn-ribbon protein
VSEHAAAQVLGFLNDRLQAARNEYDAAERELEAAKNRLATATEYLATVEASLRHNQGVERNLNG